MKDMGTQYGPALKLQRCLTLNAMGRPSWPGPMEWTARCGPISRADRETKEAN